MSAETAAVLRAARELIATPERWTQGANARDDKGNSYLTVSSANVVCRCAYGAVLTASKGYTGQTRNAIYALEAAARLRSECLSEWNDSKRRTHADVLAAFGRAIAAEEGGTDGG